MHKWWYVVSACSAGDWYLFINDICFHFYIVCTQNDWVNVSSCLFQDTKHSLCYYVILQFFSTWSVLRSVCLSTCHNFWKICKTSDVKNGKVMSKFCFNKTVICRGESDSFGHSFSQTHLISVVNLTFFLHSIPRKFNFGGGRYMEII